VRSTFFTALAVALIAFRRTRRRLRRDRHDRNFVRACQASGTIMQEDLSTFIVGKGNVNEGLVRIALYICVFGTLFWWLIG